MTKQTPKIQDIPLAHITPPREDVRHAISPDALHELAASMAALGQLSPICLHHSDKPPYEIIYGHRRYLAARLLGWKTIKAIFSDNDQTTNYIARAAENLIREDLNVIEEATIYHHLNTDHGLTTKEIAQLIGRSEMHIHRTLKALDLPDYAKEALQKKEITFSALLPLLSIEDPETRDYYMKYAIQNGATQAVTRNWAATYKAAKQQKIQEAATVVITQEPRHRLVYIPCQLCETPTDVETMRHITLCPTCYDYLTGQTDTHPSINEATQNGNTTQTGH